MTVSALLGRVAITTMAGSFLASCAETNGPPPGPEPVESVFVSPSTASLTVGQSLTLTATPRDAAGQSLSGRSVTWSSNALTIASVSAQGEVTALSPGAATITATVEAKHGSSTITVVAGPPTQIAIRRPDSPIRAGEANQFTAFAADARGNVVTPPIYVTWEVLDPTVATVTESGTVRAYVPGPFRIRASDPTGTLAVANNRGDRFAA